MHHTDMRRKSNTKVQERRKEKNRARKMRRNGYAKVNAI